MTDQDPLAPTSTTTATTANDPGPAPTVPPRPTPGTVAPEQWESKFHGVRGAFMQAQATWNEKEGMLTQNVQSLQAQLATMQEQLAAAQTQSSTLQTQVDGIAALQEQAGHAQELELQVDRLGTIMDYPEIIAQATTVTTGEGDDAVTEQQNPYMDLLMSSTLGPEDFEKMVNQMAEKLRAGQPLPASPEPPEPAPTVPVGTPPPPAPTGEGTLEALKKKAMDEQMAGNYAAAEKLWDAYNDKLTSKP